MLLTGVYCVEAEIYLNTARPTHLISCILHNVFLNQEPGPEHYVSLGLGYIGVRQEEPSLLIIFITYGIKEGSEFKW